MSADRSPPSSRRPGGGGRGPRPPGGRPVGRGERRPSGRPAPRRVPTAAERRAAEVNARRADRAPRDEAAERAKIEGRVLEEWIDDGDLRVEAAQATTRAQGATGASGRPTRRSTPRDVAPDDAADIAGAARDRRRAGVLQDLLVAAQQALDRDRVDDARRIAQPLARELPGVAAVHEVLGLAAYRSGRWKQAVSELAFAQELRPNVELLPVLADAHRALRHWREVDQLWAEIRAVSPAADVLAEARIVAAGALADQGDLSGALRTMGKATTAPKRVRDHHLRQWYVLGDLHDRAGDPLEAARWFEQIARHDRDFVDVVDRLRALGR